MTLKIFICLLAIAHFAIGIEVKHEHEYENEPVAYEFHYSVHDPHTGDIKSQKETRKDDKVEGSYELIDSDGYRRIVKYTADDHRGFEAIVTREPTNIKIPIPEQHHGEKTVTEHKVVGRDVNLVHYAPKPVVAAKPAFYHSGGRRHYVSFSGPSHSYKY